MYSNVLDQEYYYYTIIYYGICLFSTVNTDIYIKFKRIVKLISLLMNFHALDHSLQCISSYEDIRLIFCEGFLIY